METVSLASLWLPVLLAAVVVFSASAVIWMVIKWHDSDWKKLPDEEAARAALKGVPRGDYTVPYAMTTEVRASEEMQKNFDEGPMVMMTFFASGVPNMGRQLGLWFGYCLVVSLFIAYVLSATTSAGAPYLQVFQVAGTVAFLTYGGSAIPASIWFGQGWARTFKNVADGLVYGLLTAGVFGWLWP
ncbi:MAG: hypothetical protein HKN59_05525 [Gammaproteobacteria bacterium]|nr:hypothetical protein [Gammaproteobacteria bacterium]